MPMHPEDTADRDAAEAIRASLRDVHDKIVKARQRGLKVELALGGIGYSNFDPCSTAVTTVIRERLI